MPRSFAAAATPGWLAAGRKLSWTTACPRLVPGDASAWIDGADRPWTGAATPQRGAARSMTRHTPAAGTSPAPRERRLTFGLLERHGTGEREALRPACALLDARPSPYLVRRAPRRAGRGCTTGGLRPGWRRARGARIDAGESQLTCSPTRPCPRRRPQQPRPRSAGAAATASCAAAACCARPWPAHPLEGISRRLHEDVRPPSSIAEAPDLVTPPRAAIQRQLPCISPDGRTPTHADRRRPARAFPRVGQPRSRGRSPDLAAAARREQRLDTEGLCRHRPRRGPSRGAMRGYGAR